MEQIQINRLSSPTWRHLKMNAAAVSAAPYQHAFTPSFELPSGVTASHGGKPPVIDTGCGEALTRLLDSTADTEPFRFDVSGETDAPLRLHYSFGEQENATSRISLYAAPHSSVTVIAFYESGEHGRAAVQTLLRADAYASVHLVQVIRVGSGFSFINDVGIQAEEHAQVEITQLYLGGGQVYGGTLAALAGCQSRFKNDIGYRLTGSESLDLHLLARQSGARSESDVTVKGVLADRSRKIFRGTIDFLQGASGAKGAENEEVLLMSQQAVNQTVPVILCAEEDVEGSHGASIGRLDEELVFYMMTRGLSREQIDTAMANAKIEAVMRHIDDRQTLDRITDILGGTTDEP